MHKNQGSILRSRLSLLTCIAILTCCSVLPAGSQEIDVTELDDTGRFRVVGVSEEDRVARDLSALGDINSDGLADFAVTSEGIDDSGQTHVVFGDAVGTTLEIGDLGERGFQIDGNEPGDFARVVSGVGDFNGDGRDDFIVGAPGAATMGVSIFDVIDSAGTAYVIFGKDNTSDINLGSLGPEGIRVLGDQRSEAVGSSVSGAGDVNGDGLADLVLSSRREAFVVFGSVTPTSFRTTEVGGRGFRIGRAGGPSISEVTGAGDVNGDGLADVAIGFAFANADNGEVFVVFGKEDFDSVDLDQLNGRGFSIAGESNTQLGFELAGLGDVNGDGLADLGLASRPAERGYVVYGKSDSGSVAVDNLGDAGFTIDGDMIGRLGQNISGANDVNGDGYADIIVGTGALAYVIFGSPNSASVNVTGLGAAGYQLMATGPFGNRVSGAGDINGDGLPDLIVGSSAAEVNGIEDAGEAYGVFGGLQASNTAVYRAAIPNGDAPRVAIGVTGDGSNPSHPDSRVWIDFDDGEDFSELASPIRVTLTRNAGAFFPAAAQISWRIESPRQNWTQAKILFRYVEDELLVPEAAVGVSFSPTGQAPFETIEFSRDPVRNTLSIMTDRLGYFYLGQVALADPVFSDGFE